MFPPQLKLYLVSLQRGQELLDGRDGQNPEAAISDDAVFLGATKICTIIEMKKKK